jgi:hypothetical protein
MTQRPLLHLGVLAVLLSGCTATDLPTSHPKVGSILATAKALASASSRDPGFLEARYHIPISPTLLNVSSYHEPAGGPLYRLLWSPETIRDANVAVVVESLLLPGGGLSTGTHQFFWSNGRWHSEMEMYERIYGKEELERELEHLRSRWPSTSPTTSRASGAVPDE